MTSFAPHYQSNRIPKHSRNMARSLVSLHLYEIKYHPHQAIQARNVSEAKERIRKKQNPQTIRQLKRDNPEKGKTVEANANASVKIVSKYQTESTFKNSVFGHNHIRYNVQCTGVHAATKEHVKSSSIITADDQVKDKVVLNVKSGEEVHGKTKQVY